MLILIAQKKRLGALNASQVSVTEKIKKNHQNIPNIGIIGENLHFWMFFLIFSLTVLGKDLWFFALRSVLFKISKFGFASSYQGNKNSFEILKMLLKNSLRDSLALIWSI